ncbi:hypothetical protein [Ostreibacterium oceani]|uniref:Uncharacterized protein n=1 Tax=Ostreibacterium oceani TaxID=2654998 RepID=A0A6N7EY19_9GAMM|nr:hypothetical protein [Ostreibacterium oceani]MPV86843.1 hypothetical protein [Ostreibacterium oceani]
MNHRLHSKPFIGLIALYTIISTSSTNACEHILGKWQSSKSLSLDYAKQRTDKKYSDKQIQLLQDIFGIGQVEFTPTSYIFFIPEHTTRIQDQLKKNAEQIHTNNIVYTVCQKDKVIIAENQTKLKENKHTIEALKIMDISIEEFTTHTLHFVDKNTYWTSPLPRMSNLREYFVRIPKD